MIGDRGDAVWLGVIGIPLDLWMNASTPAEVRALIKLREQGAFAPHQNENSDGWGVAIYIDEQAEPVAVYDDLHPDPTLVELMIGPGE